MGWGVGKGRRAWYPGNHWQVQRLYCCCVGLHAHMRPCTLTNPLSSFLKLPPSQDPEESYTSMVAFLDDQEGAGWDFLGKLLQGQTSALELSQHPFLKAKEKAKK